MSERPSAGQRWALAALLVWAFALRAWYGAHGLDDDRFWDERYALENVASILETGSLEPANGWYPGLAHLPYAALLAELDAVHRATGDERLAVFVRRGFGPAAYLACRLVQALLGVATLALTYRIGRRLFSPGVGLLAAFLLAVMPMHLRLSAYYKPDILLLACALLALDLALTAAERPRLRRFVAAGAAVGLALASKLTGGAAAVPVAIAAAGGGKKIGWGRALLWLAAPGGMAAAVFLVLNPWPRIVFSALGENAEIYGRRGAAAGQSRLGVLGAEVAALLSPAFHGPLAGGLALAGLALLAGAVWHGRRDRDPLWTGRAMLLAYGLAFSLLYAAGAGFAKANNFLQVAPVTALAAAWAAVTAWRQLATPGTTTRLRPVAAVAGLALAAIAGWLLWAVHADAYAGVVPTTRAAAAERLAAALPPPLDGQVVVVEGEGPFAVRGWARRPWRRVVAASWPVDRLSELPEGALDLADAEVFERARLDGPEAALYRGRLAVGAETVAAAPFARRGPDLVLVVHPWQPVGEPATLRLAPTGGSFSGGLPDDLRPGEVVSFEVWLPDEAAAERAPDAAEEAAEGPAPRLVVGGIEVPLLRTRSRGNATRWVTPRVRVPAAGERVALAAPPALSLPNEVELTVRRWWR